jgi:hypothetical protein
MATERDETREMIDEMMTADTERRRAITAGIVDEYTAGVELTDAEVQWIRTAVSFARTREWNDGADGKDTLDSLWRKLRGEVRMAVTPVHRGAEHLESPEAFPFGAPPIKP